MSRKEELRATANKALAEIWEIEHAEAREKNQLLVGKCFAYRNCFSCPEGPEDYWMLWQKVIGIDEFGDPVVFRFQTDKNGRIEIEEHRTIGTLGEEVSEDVFTEAWRKLADQVGTLGKKVMYYEEKQIDGVWYYRTRPDGEWVRSAWQGNNV